MGFKLVVDSCCDLTPELRAALGITVIPLTITLGEKSFLDDDRLHMPTFLEAMKACTERIGSAAPSPILFKEACRDPHTNFVVTLSDGLSCSYANAVLGKSLAEEDYDADVHVVNSKSASAGELLIALELKRLIDAGCSKDQIVTSIEEFIRGMKTYFVLNNFDTLMKNGRLNKIVGKSIGLLGIKLLFGSDGNGHIALYGSIFHVDQIADRLAGTVAKHGQDTSGRSMVISHCNNPTLAEKLRRIVENRYDFKEIFVVPTSGLSSVYASDGGVVMAY